MNQPSFRPLAAIALLLAAIAAPQAAEGPSPEERAQAAIDTRQGVFKLIYHYFGPIAGMARGMIPFDAAVVEENSNKISQLATMIDDVFKSDTSAFDLETGALDDIWEDGSEFGAKAQNLAAKAAALAAAAQAGEDAFPGAFRATGGACKSCHDDYRQQD